MSASLPFSNDKLFLSSRKAFLWLSSSFEFTSKVDVIWSIFNKIVQYCCRDLFSLSLSQSECKYELNDVNFARKTSKNVLHCLQLRRFLRRLCFLFFWRRNISFFRSKRKKYSLSLSFCFFLILFLSQLSLSLQLSQRRFNVCYSA